MRMITEGRYNTRLPVFVPGKIFCLSFFFLGFLSLIFFFFFIFLSNARDTWIVHVSFTYLLNEFVNFLIAQTNVTNGHVQCQLEK